MPEFNIHSFKAASTNSDMDEAPSKTSREANKPSPVPTSVAESCNFINLNNHNWKTKANFNSPSREN